MIDPVRRGSEFLLYTAPDGAVKVDVLFKDETAWLTQKTIAELFGVGVPAINKHLKNIFESEELEPVATISKMEMVRSRAYLPHRFERRTPIGLTQVALRALELSTDPQVAVPRQVGLAVTMPLLPRPLPGPRNATIAARIGIRMPAAADRRNRRLEGSTRITDPIRASGAIGGSGRSQASPRKPNAGLPEASRVQPTKRWAYSWPPCS